MNQITILLKPIALLGMVVVFVATGSFTYADDEDYNVDTSEETYRDTSSEAEESFDYPQLDGISEEIEESTEESTED